MSTEVRLKRKVRFRVAERSRKAIRSDGADDAPPSGSVPRVARLMALAIRFDRLIQDGHVCDQAELARLGYVTRARVTQVMALLNLAPEIQESVLFLPRTEHGRDPICERHLRPIAAELDWSRQRRMWSKLQSRLER